MGPVKFDTARKIAFLEHYGGCGLMIQASLAAGVCDNTVRAALDRDPAFKSAYEYASARFKERLEAEAMRRGHDGWMEPVVQKGRVVHHDCATCHGFGRVVPEDSKLTIKEWPESRFTDLPKCTACGGTGQGDIVYAFKADSAVFQKLLQRHIPEYREHVEIDQKVSGGVLVVGTPASSTEDWNAQWAGKRAPVIDAQFSAVDRVPATSVAANSQLPDADVHPAGDYGDAGIPENERVTVVERKPRPYNHAGSGVVTVRHGK